MHGNYLAAADWDFLAQRAERMAVVYCPRTHTILGTSHILLAAMLRRGVRVVVGTDSRASNPDLSLWEELRTVARTHPQVAPDRILRMGTLDAAAALGCDDEVGSLEPGKRADLALVRIQPSAASRSIRRTVGCEQHAMQCARCAADVFVGSAPTAIEEGGWQVRPHRLADVHLGEIPLQFATKASSRGQQ